MDRLVEFFNTFNQYCISFPTLVIYLLHDFLSSLSFDLQGRLFEAENYMTFLLGEARKEVQAVEDMEKQAEEGQQAGAPEEEVKVRVNSPLCPILHCSDGSVSP